MKNVADLIACFNVVDAEISLFESFDQDKRKAAANHIASSNNLLQDTLVDADAMQQIIYQEQLRANDLIRRLDQLIEKRSNENETGSNS